VKRALQQALIAPFLLVPACATTGGDPAAAGTAASDEHAAHVGHAAQADPVSHTEDTAHAGHQPVSPGWPGVTEADVRFMQDMIGHHAQALVMAAMVETHGAGEQLRFLARKIDISQRDEIAMMEQWLIDRGQAVPDPDAGHDHALPMPGMLTPQQLSELDAARGREFERLFLTFMIRHHEGALVMVDALFASPGAAQDSDIFRFATDVAADQLDEIDQMQHLLDTMATHRRSEIR
jgi:uncharacterized protein (DUF305 family)